MKTLRILFACTLGLFASVALVRAEDHAEKKHDAPAAAAGEKKVEAADAHAADKKHEAGHVEKEHSAEKHEAPAEHKAP